MFVVQFQAIIWRRETHYSHIPLDITHNIGHVPCHCLHREGGYKISAADPRIWISKVTYPSGKCDCCMNFYLPIGPEPKCIRYSIT